MLTHDEVVDDLRAAGALLDGHFILTSGLHSAQYFQSARVFSDPKRSEKLCVELARLVKAQGLMDGVDLIVSPALGGIIAGYEMGRQLGRRAVYLERADGEFALRRGFEIRPGENCLIVDGVVTTGLSIRESIQAVTGLGGRVAGACALVDRSGGRANVGAAFVSLLQLDIPTYTTEALPDHLRRQDAVKPGTRPLKNLTRS